MSAPQTNYYAESSNTSTKKGEPAVKKTNRKQKEVVSQPEKKEAPKESKSKVIESVPVVTKVKDKTAPVVKSQDKKPTAAKADGKTKNSKKKGESESQPNMKEDKRPVTASATNNNLEKAAKKSKSKVSARSVEEEVQGLHTLTLEQSESDNASTSPTPDSSCSASTTSANIDTETKASKSSTKNVNTSKKMAALKAELNDDDFPSLSFCNKPLKPAVVETKKSKSSKTVSPNIASSLDYPTLKAANPAPPPSVVKKPPPGLGGAGPPGLTSGPAPPPGMSRIITNGRPPGLTAAPSPEVFTLSSVASMITTDTSPRIHRYVEPANFSQRNKKLSFRLKDLIHNDMAKFHSFRTLSGDFRNNSISAQQFYEGCMGLLGRSVFLDILPELLVLLPDLEKQDALYILSADAISEMQASRSWSLSPQSNSLDQCTTCGQILSTSDVSSHNANHGEGITDFPALSSSKPITMHANNRPVAAGARQAW